METGGFGLVERFLFRERWEKVGEMGEDWGVRRRTYVDMGISVSEWVRLWRDSAPSFNATGL